MYERLTKCPLCQSGLFLNHLVVKDHSVSGESFTICKCSNCHFLFTNPRPDQSHIDQYYESNNYISHTNKSTNLVNIIYKLVRKFTLQQKVNWINKYCTNRERLLDFGCGTGHFLAEAQKKGWFTVGYEPNPQAAQIAETQHQLHLLKNPKNIGEEKKFDAITLFHVLEHVHDLRGTMDLLLSRLKKRGTLFLAVPNFDSLDSQLYKEKWASLDVPRHLYHFTQETMTQLANEYDLRIVAKEPMLFDSYYVSILSEEIKKNRKNFIKSFITGYKSNQYAKMNNNNFSSILFILKKK
ncbi:class I SAM-dependent methyltransferase [Echinicola jeungdonensis]|uniref:Class I SAM-dependent methyltransferase n=1 Tax=Echinicola jeungdonensis TaxID=709343 RepID=A0ABV5J7V4_9BACT|nr:class I SAM-dependent methyltransferase [Echinicola jeungdonensis]MDN3669096.1 class I SAM-dependent methyltransferase [Echinicola jeungdonensis]